MERQERTHANMEATDTVDTKQSKQRASIKWLLSKAFNNRVPENLQEPFYRDHEDQEHLKPPIVGGLANAELYCLALANMYSDPNYHSLNHWNILQTLARKGVHVPDPPDCELTETVLIQTNPLKMVAHMSVVEALMMLYAREVVTPDRVSAAAQRFGTSQPPPIQSGIPHEDGLLIWINAACAALNMAEEDTSSHVPIVKKLQDVCDGTALAALISFYCPDALPRTSVRVGRMASIQDCLHNLRLVYDFCRTSLPHNVFHMMPEDVTYMRGSMRQNLIAMLADLFNMLEVHPAKSVKCPASEARDSNEHGVRHKRSLPPPPPAAIPDLRPERASHGLPFAVPRSPSASGVRGRAARSSCSTPERRSVSPPAYAQPRDDFVVHRGRAVPTLASVVRRDDDNMSVDMNTTAAGRPSNWADTRDVSFAGRRSRRSSISDDSQLTVENFGGSQDRLHFAGRNPEKELATVTNNRKISAPAGLQDSYNPPLRSSRQDIRGSIQFFHGDFENDAPEPKPKPKIDRQHSQPQTTDLEQPYFPIKRQLSSDTITLSQTLGYNYKGGGDGFFLNVRDATDGDNIKTSFADLNKIRSNGDQPGIQSIFNQSESEPERRKSTSFVTAPANTTTWQQLMQQDTQPNGDDMTDDRTTSPNGGAMAAQLNNIRLKLEEKRRRIEQEKRRMEVAVSRQRQQLGQQAFLQAVTRGKGARTPQEDEAREDKQIQDMVEPSNQNVDAVAMDQYQQSIAKMNSSLQDIQSDIARLASQQNQLQQQQQAKQLFQPNQGYQPPPSPYQQQQQQPYQQQNIPQLHNQFSSQHNVSRPGLASFGSTPHIPQQQYYQQPNYQQPNYQPQQQYRDIEDYNQFYLHESSAPAPAPPQRRTWAQHAVAQQTHNDEPRAWQIHQQNHQQPPPHQQHQQLPPHHQLQQPPPHQQHHQPPPHQQHQQPPPHQQHQQLPQHQQQHHQQHHQQPPQHQQIHHEQHSHLQQQHQQSHQQPHQQQQYQSQQEPPPQRTWKSPSPQPERNWQPQQGFVLHDRNERNDRNDRNEAFQVHYSNQNGTDSQNHLSYTVTKQYPSSRESSPRRARPVSLQQLRGPPTSNAPPPDMEPQNISFIGNAEDEALRHGIDRLNISSGTRTYRLPSPTRPSLGRNSFQQMESEDSSERPEKGFYISFDNEQPKRPKPPLRVKRMSQKDRSQSTDVSPERSPDRSWPESRDPFPVQRAEFPVHHQESLRPTPPRPSPNDPVRPLRPGAEPAALVIGELNPDPNSAEEMERKKERIMLLSLQRRAAADEARARAGAAAAARRAREEAVAEQRRARREDQARRREQILHQYKLKKAMEEAEREGKVFDKSEFMESLRGGSSEGSTPAATPAGPRLRNRVGARARPKTIHVDGGALQAAEGLLAKQPSSTNLTAGGGTMRRDYYRGSQDSLAERAGLYRESPVDDRGGMSPSSASSGALGRRGSCKTSRERVNEEPQAARGRSKYSTYQNNFKAGRKSSSLMNLCDSGLGRATPPRRAASPGLRTLGSPASGPGSLPGGVGRRRAPPPDDVSDVSSTHSSIMDYSGPRLYKQPTTKSNRGIMLNAVEYCVFPGAVNAEAKRRVLEEIARSEAKHFLVLFRDAGCQFRALYSYCPDTEQVTKLYGTGPKHVNDRMFDKFFKYNSGSKCFSQVHTKHLTVTIDAFTIHNSLWQGKKVQLPSKKDMALVI